MNSSAKRRAVCGKVVSYKEESDEELEGDYEEAKKAAPKKKKKTATVAKVVTAATVADTTSSFTSMASTANNNNNSKENTENCSSPLSSPLKAAASPSGDKSDDTPQEALKFATSLNRIKVSPKQKYYRPTDFNGLCTQVVPDSSKFKMTVNVYRYGRTSPQTTDGNKGLGQVMAVSVSENIIEDAFDDVHFKYHDNFIIAQNTSKYCSFDDSNLANGSRGNYADESPGLDALVGAIERCPHNETAVVLVTELTRICLTDTGYRKISDRIRDAHPSGKDFVAIYSLSEFGLDDDGNEKLCKCRTILEETRRVITAEYSNRYPQKSFTRTEADEKKQNKILEDAAKLRSCLSNVDSDEYDIATEAVKRGTDISDEESMTALQKFIGVYDNDELSVDQNVIELKKMKKEESSKKSPKYDVVLTRVSPSCLVKSRRRYYLPGTDVVPLHQLSLGMTHANPTSMVVVTDPGAKARTSWRTNLALGRALHMYFNNELNSLTASNPNRVTIEQDVIDIIQRCMPTDWRECQGLEGVEVIVAEGKRRDELTECLEKYHFGVEELLESRSEGMQAIGKELNSAATALFNIDQSKDIPVMRRSSGIQHPSIQKSALESALEPPIMLHDLKHDPVVQPAHPNEARLNGVQFTQEGLITSARTTNIINWERKLSEGEQSMAHYGSLWRSLPEGTDEARVKEMKKKEHAAHNKAGRNRNNINGAHADAVVKVCVALIKKETKTTKKDALKKLKKNLEEDAVIEFKGERSKYSGKPKKDNQHDSEGCKAANASFTRWRGEMDTNTNSKKKLIIAAQLMLAKKEYYACKAYDSLKLARDGTDCNNLLGAELIKHLKKRLDKKAGSRVKVYGGKTKYHHTAKALTKIQSMSIAVYSGKQTATCY